MTDASQLDNSIQDIATKTSQHGKQARSMSTNILIICPNPAPYISSLQPAFPDVRFTSVAALECTEALKELPSADAIFAYGRAFDRACLIKSERLKWIQCLITGTDHLTPVLAGSGIVLTNARGIHGPQMAEAAILHMMSLYRDVPQLVRNQAAHVWDRFKPRVLDHRTVVILGVGAIAEHVARVCKAFGMTTIGVSRTPRIIEGFDRFYPRDKLLEAAAQADFLLVLVPYSKDTDKIVDDSVFGVMKPTACLINLARGGVVDEAALVRAIEEGKISGAGLDVFESTPLPPSSPLWDMKNVFITPFIGGQSDQYEQSIMSNRICAAFSTADTKT
jgi:D-2-hydroxyacid dehydrogenase (NADP+)